MSESQVWFITGANRGIGAEVARAALASGARVVAAARRPEAVTDALGSSDDLLATALDVTRDEDVAAAVAAATDRFGRVDVLVNNAGYGQLGFFEELSSEQIARQFATNVFGAMSVTRAVLPLMRAQRSGHVITISSLAGTAAAAGASAYCGSKFAVEGWMECLALELEPFGLHATIVAPGFFRTDFLDATSVAYGERAVDDYAPQSAEFRAWHDDRNHHQAGDPARLAEAVVTLAAADAPPVRFAAGADAVEICAAVHEQRRAELETWRDLSVSLAHAD